MSDRTKYRIDPDSLLGTFVHPGWMKELDRFDQVLVAILLVIGVVLIGIIFGFILLLLSMAGL